MRFLRCSPGFDHSLRDEHDAMLWEGLSAVMNIHMSDTMATSQCFCDEWRLGDSTCCIACTSSILGVCCGHFRSSMLHPFTLPIVRQQGGFSCSYTLMFAHRHPCAIGTPEIVSKSLRCALVGTGLSLSEGSSIITIRQSQTTCSNSCLWLWMDICATHNRLWSPSQQQSN